jgi:aminoglycoside/choline kinase family phosphotransferase
MPERADLIARFLAANGWGDAERRKLAGDASFRRYDRLTRGGERAVLMDAPPPMEDVRPFARLARHLGGIGYSAPRVLAEDAAAGLLLLEDLGDDTYTRMLASGGDEQALYELAVDLLADLHGRPAAEAIPTGLAPYDAERLLTEALLLTDWFMPAALGRDTDAACRDAYVAAWREAMAPVLQAPPVLVLRDFHVDNLMWLRDRTGLAACGLLDFQDALAGHAAYDLMSLVEDARRDIQPAFHADMLARYLAAFPGIDEALFRRDFAILAAQRHAKVIGIFTRLWRRDAKPDYLVHIPRVWRLLERALAEPALAPVAGWLETYLAPEHRRRPDNKE